MKLDCDVIRDLLPLYAEKLASPASSALVEQHLAECPACRAELERMEKPVPVQPEPESVFLPGSLSPLLFLFPSQQPADFPYHFHLTSCHR